ncbi:hypothetical protein GCM10022281_05140 [Sphingomonas rosea]|uniref:Calx-beta domain-containing protein n=1 Tax=Sphingomonas rosea TaxID=335605 RepID=A0ABP7TNL9_9SPHN
MTIGLNISGGEFNGTGGTADSTYHYPSLSDLQFYNAKGVDLIRVPVVWERLQDSLGGPLDLSGDIALLKQMMVNAASLGMDVIIDLHSYGRYNGIPIGAPGGPTVEQFAAFWKAMATEFKDYPALAGYDLMNEPHDMPTPTTWKTAAQAATDAIRSVDTSNIIYMEGDGWSSAHTWLDNNANMIINDPTGKMIYVAHSYYDNYNQGFYNGSYDQEHAYPTIGVDRLKPFVDWLNANGLKGQVGEFGVPSDDPRWLEVQKITLDYMNAQGLEGIAWGGGTWFATNYKLFTAAPGTADSAYMNLLENYFTKYQDPFGGTTPPPPPPPPPSTGVAPVIALESQGAYENGGFITFTLTRSGDLSAASSVNFATADGSAQAGQDYVASTGTVTFAAGQASATVKIAIIDDTLVEYNESMRLLLSGASNATLKDVMAYGTIISDDTVNTPPSPAAPQVAIADVTANEATGAITFTLTRSGDLSGASSVNFATADGSAIAGSDYVAKSGTVSFAAGAATATVTVTLVNDTLVEGNETLLLNLTGGSNATIADNQAVGTIVSDDLAPAPVKPSVAVNDVTANEANGTLTFTLTRTGDLSAASSVNFATADGTALAGSDYVARSGTASFAAGAATATVTINLVNDTLVEGNETLLLNLAGGSNITIADAQGVGTIVSDDVAPPPPTGIAPSISVDGSGVGESEGLLTFTLTRSGDLSAASTVNYATADGSAQAGLDYVAAAGTITFAAGQATAIVKVAVIDDALVEYNESFRLVLSGGSNATIANGQAYATIVNDDTATSASTLVLKGTDLAETITGSGAKETIFGLGGNDVINGGGGGDQLVGGLGNDTFVFDTSATANGQKVLDFTVGADKLDFTKFDASTLATGVQKFTWIDEAAFGSQAGQLRQYDAGGHHYVAGDTNGDGVADFTIEVMGVTHLSASDLFL